MRPDRSEDRHTAVGDLLTPNVVAARSNKDLTRARPNDLFVRYSAPRTTGIDALVAGGGVAWVTPSRRSEGRWMTAIGSAEEVRALVATARATRPDLAGATLPRASLADLSPADALEEPNEWDWFVTSVVPPPQPYEDRVAWAPPGTDAALTDLLDEHSPRYSARPGDAKVLRWCVLSGDGVLGADRDLLAAAAHVEHLPGVAHLASIVTRTDARGRGLGAAVTAWITRTLLAEGHPVVTLGMYADNDSARRLYHRLGYRDTHHFASGSFATSNNAANGADDHEDCG